MPSILQMPPCAGYTRVSVRQGDRIWTRYDTVSIQAHIVASDPFHFPPLAYYWEDGAMALRTSIEQYVAHKNNAPAE